MTNKTFNFYCLLIITYCCIACSGGASDDDILTSTEYLNVPSQIAVAGDGNQKGQLNISADCGWTISGAPSWMSLSANSGNKNATIEITCTKNPSSTDERSAVLTVTTASGKIKKTVTVIQSIADETINTNLDEVFFISDGESKTLAIQSNTSWTIKGAEEWFTLSRTEGNGDCDITVTAKKNEQETARNATLTIQGTNASVRVNIKQEGHITTLTVSPTLIKAGAVSNTYELFLEGDATWNASVNVDWCTLNKLSGVGGDKLTVTVKDNTTNTNRNATITFATSNDNKFCEVEQYGGVLPSITDFTITEVQRYSFKAFASYSSEYVVTEYGICYSETNVEPTIKDCVSKKEVSSYSGNISMTIDGLQSGKAYYVRAFAKSVIGTAYSVIKKVKTSGSIPDEDDIVTPQI